MSRTADYSIETALLESLGFINENGMTWLYDLGDRIDPRGFKWRCRVAVCPPDYRMVYRMPWRLWVFPDSGPDFVDSFDEVYRRVLEAVGDAP